MASGFGTGSAAPFDGDDSIKRTAALFAPRATQRPAAAGAAAASSSISSSSSSRAAGGSWVSSLGAVWRNLGVASATGGGGGPSGKEVKDIQWDVSALLVWCVCVCVWRAEGALCPLLLWCACGLHCNLPHTRHQQAPAAAGEKHHWSMHHEISTLPLGLLSAACVAGWQVLLWGFL
jgi:hypothetical protein